MDSDVVYKFIGGLSHIPGIPARDLTAVDLEKITLDGYPLALLEKSGLYKELKAQQPAPKKDKVAFSKQAQAPKKEGEPDLESTNGIDPLEDEKS